MTLANWRAVTDCDRHGHVGTVGRGVRRGVRWWGVVVALVAVMFVWPPWLVFTEGYPWWSLVVLWPVFIIMFGLLLVQHLQGSWALDRRRRVEEPCGDCGMWPMLCGACALSRRWPAGKPGGCEATLRFNTLTVLTCFWGFVAAVYGPTRGHENDKPTRDANARLIAAAPDLLEALLWLRSRSPIVYAMLKRAPGTGVKEIDVLDHRALDDDLLRVQQVINAAIAKATGASR